MSVASMTGFARITADLPVHNGAPRAMTVEMRSVNHKALDVRLRLPTGFEAADGPIRKILADVIGRGALSMTLSVQEVAAPQRYSINEDLLNQLIHIAREKDRGHPPRIENLLSVRGVVTEETDASFTPSGLENSDVAAVTQAVRDAAAALQDARLEEGARLSIIVTGLLDQLTGLTANAAQLASTQPDALRTRLQARLAELETSVDPERLAQEVALLASKADVREELDRLVAHIEAARGLLAQGSPCGRKLDFLTQELGREANTLCSKVSDLELTRIGLAMKAVIEQVKEQVQNIA